MVELGQVEQNAYAAYSKHKDQEYSFFCWTRHVALHLLHTWVTVTLEHPWDVKAVQEVLAGQEANFQRVPEHHLDDVETGDALLPPYFCTFVCWDSPPGSVWDLLDIHIMVILAFRVHQDAIDVAGMKFANMMVVVAAVVAVPMVVHVGMEQRIASITCFGRLVDRIGDEAKAGRAHQDDLEHPIADVRDGERLVVTRLVTAGLHSVTDEHDLFVFIHLLANYPNY